jgi:hypothetical protein
VVLANHGMFAVPEEEGHRTSEACGSSEGGIVIRGEVGVDVPRENIRTMDEAFREDGMYTS